MIRRPDHRRFPSILFPMIQVFGFGVTLLTVVGIFLAVPVNAQTVRIASPDQQSDRYSEAFENWMLLAIEGDAAAQFNLGLLYSEGKGVPVDYRQSAFWYRKGAEQGHTGAQYNLAHLYLDGHGVDKDPAQATHWWRQAAQRGHVLAQQYLGYAYYKGIGVNKDKQEALRWFREAAKGGDWRAKKMLATIAQTFEPTSKTAEQPGAPDEFSLRDMPQPVPDQPTARALAQTEHHGKTGSTPASAADQQAAVASTPDPQPVQNSPPAPAAEQTDDQTIIAAFQGQITAQATDEQHTAFTKPTTVSSESGTDPQTAPPQAWVTTAVPADGPAPALRGPESVATEAPEVSADTPPTAAQPETIMVPGELPVAAVKLEDDQLYAASESEPGVTVRSRESSREDQADIGADPQAPAVDSEPLPPDSQTVNRLQQPRIAKSAASEQTSSMAGRTSAADNDQWLFAQPPDFFTLQLISAPRRATVDGLIRQQRLKNIRLLRTQVNGVRWWYVLSGSYPSREQANAAAAASIVEQNSIWVRRFGVLQENRCKNLSATGLSAFCDGPSVRVPTGGSQRRLETGQRQPSASEQSAASVEQAVATGPAKPPASTEPQQLSTGSMVAAELFAVASGNETTVAGLRHDDNAWLFAQPEDYYTVQLISVPDVSQVASFLRDNELQDKAIYYTTRRAQRDWFFAISGSHPDLDAAKQATKSLPVTSGSVWIRQFDAIQKRQCQIANQLPAGASDALNFYCRP